MNKITFEESIQLLKILLHTELSLEVITRTLTLCAWGYCLGEAMTEAGKQIKAEHEARTET